MFYQIVFLKGRVVVETLSGEFDSATAARDHAVILMGAVSRKHVTGFQVRKDGGAVLARWPDA